MSAAKRPRPLSVVLLVMLVGFQALSGLFGGGTLVLDPSGGLLQMPLSVLDQAPFTDFLVPGLTLLLVLGVFPLVITVVLWSEPAWNAAARVERAFGAHWAWVGAAVVAVGLLIWLVVELWMVGYSLFLLLYGGVGVAILALALLPSTRRYYRLETGVTTRQDGRHVTL